MKSERVSVLSIIELKNARWNIEIRKELLFFFYPVHCCSSHTNGV